LFVRCCGLLDVRNAKDVDVRGMLLTFMMCEGRKIFISPTNHTNHTDW
jgi:hypothetical protein